MADNPPAVDPRDELDDDYWMEFEPECCGRCGKEFEDFSDLGCGYCDSRHPEWGLL